MHIEWCFLSVLEKNSKTALRHDGAILTKYGVSKAVFLTIETGYHLFDAFPTRTEHETYVYMTSRPQSSMIVFFQKSFLLLDLNRFF